MDSFSVSAQGQISVEYTIDGQNAAPFGIGHLIVRADGTTPATLLQTIEVDDPSQLIGGGATYTTARVALGAIHRSGLSTGQVGQPPRKSFSRIMPTTFHHRSAAFLSRTTQSLHVFGGGSLAHDHLTIMQDATTGDVLP